MLTATELERVTAPLPSARSLPSGAYTSADIYDAECQTIFRQEWVCVAREEQIPNAGDYRTVDVAGQPLIVVRLEDGSIHAMSAICTHRAMPLAEGCGNATFSGVRITSGSFA